MRSHPGNLDELGRPQVVDRQVSADGSRKYVMRLRDGALVETVGIPHGDLNAPSKLTVCLSTQAGCSMGCAFCATGRQGLTRNLEASEMVWQVVLVGRDFGRGVDAAIAMGQGEPLANYAQVTRAMGYLGHEEGLGICPDQLIVSTCGIPSGIRALADDGVPGLEAALRGGFGFAGIGPSAKDPRCHFRLNRFSDLLNIVQQEAQDACH